mmetsp:Transcript_33378/g.43972  ORF Transcript_33378/g.43972 Transcript_33378/m.43972 type:complete len:107 (-) Transcript_33378:1122-1442(-)
MKNPPTLVKLVFDAVAILLEWNPLEWPHYQRMMLNVSAFMQQLMEFDFDSVSMAKVRKLRPIVCQAEFTYDHAKRCSCAAALLVNWVLAIYCHARDSPTTATIEPI